MENYAVLSIETHLFFSRIMKEHGIFPLLADHVLREANHYIRLLESGCED